MAQVKKRFPVIAGPTASGKSALAVELAKRLCGEVVSADSMQIYRGLTVGTAAPTEEEKEGIPHHLIGFLPFDAAYSVAQYAADARRVLSDVFARECLPILCGGTGLYIQAIVENIEFSENAVPDGLRETLRQRAETQGGAALLQELQAVDPQTAARLHENDIGRIVRALEVYLSTGQPLSEQVRLSKQTPSPYDACVFFLDFRDRDRLYRRIHDRVDRMIQNGLLDEAQRLLSGPEPPTAIQAIGYKELRPYFEGTVSLQTALEELKKSTRHYAKRQLSWFRRMPDTHVLYVDDYTDIHALTDAAMAVWQAENTPLGEEDDR